QHPDVVSLFDRLARDEQLYNSEKLRIQSISRTALADPVLRKLKLAVHATEKMIKAKRSELRPIAIRRLQDEDSTDQVAQGNADERELAMLDELEQQLNLELKSINEGNQSLTTKTLDLQSQKDEITQKQVSAAK